MTFKNTMVMVAAFGFIVLGANQADASHYYYSTTLNPTNGSIFYFTNNGVVGESFNLGLASPPNGVSLNPGDTLSGLILFTNNECLVVTNTTGTNNEFLGITIDQTMPHANAGYGYDVQLLGVSGQLAAPNPYSSSSVASGSPVSVLTTGVFNLTTSTVSFQAISFVITNEYFMTTIIHPVNLFVQGASGEISTAT